MNKKKLLEIISANEKFVITTHANPDGDAVGSVLGFYHLLKSFDKHPVIISHSPVPSYLQFADPERKIQKYIPLDHNVIIADADVIVCLDFNTIKRVNSMESEVRSSAAKKICVDHHQNPENVFDWIYSDILASSTCEMVYRMIKKINPAAFVPESILALYLGIVTDTGSFRFDRTTPEVHKITADLIAKGADIMLVTRNIYESSSMGRVKAVGEMINTMEFYGPNNEVAVIIISVDIMQRFSVRPDDTEGMEHYMMMIDSVKAGVKIIELYDGYKSSLRSKGNIPVHTVAARYGGGGHINASGIPKRTDNMREFINEVVQILLQTIADAEKK